MMSRFLALLALFLCCDGAPRRIETSRAPRLITDERGPPVEEQPVAVAPRPLPLRTFRLSCYFVANERDYPDAPLVALRTKDGSTIAMVSAAAFANMALEGSGRLKDGRLVNVFDWLPAEHADYADVLAYAQMRGWGCCPGYAGLVLDDSGNISKVRAFRVVRRLPYVPFRTVAADIGAYGSSDKNYRGSGGLVPLGTRVWLKALEGLRLPDGTVHDGWVTVTDTGANVFGAHFDLFCGEHHRWHPPDYSEAWFDGIEEKMPEDYNYGL